MGTEKADQRKKGKEDGKEVFHFSKGESEPDCKGLFVCGFVLIDIADIVDDQNGGRKRAWRDAGKKGGQGHGSRLQVIGPRNGGKAEEEEDKQFSEPEVGKRVWASRIDDCKEERKGKEAGEKDPSMPNEVAA